MNFLLLEARNICWNGMGDGMIPLVGFRLSMIGIDLLVLIDCSVSLYHTHVLIEIEQIMFNIIKNISVYWLLYIYNIWILSKTNFN